MAFEVTTPLPWRQIVELGWRSAGLPGFLRRPLDAARVQEQVAKRVQRRGAAFLEVAETLIYGERASPLRQLLGWAGCEAGDLRRMVAEDGLDAALARLHTAGVRLSADELQGKVPVRRSGKEIWLTADALVNRRAGGAIPGSTSGTSREREGWRSGAGAPRADGREDRHRVAGRGPLVRYSWEFLASEAAHEYLLLASHQLQRAPLALWLPGPPGIAGLHNLLVHAKLGRAPETWFSPSPPPVRRSGLAFWADRGWRMARRVFPRLGPAAEWVPLEDAGRVARWLAAQPQPAVLKCFASTALRVARAAQAAGLDLAGRVVFAGGEPLSAARQRFLAASGLAAFARYAATETGFLAGACPHGTDGGDMHLYADRAALIQDAATAGSGPLAVTTLCRSAPLVLLNAELGDHGTLRRARCECALGKAGLDWRVAEVHSPAKIAAEGVKLGELDFTRLVESAVRDLGGGPDDFQIWLAEGTDGAALPTLVLAAQSTVDPAALRERLRETLPVLSGGALASQLWFAGGGVTVEKRALTTGAGGKMRRVVRRSRREEDAALER